MRLTALVLAAVLATGPGCAHQQLTNKDVAAYATVILLVGGSFALCVRYDPCQRHHP